MNFEEQKLEELKKLYKQTGCLDACIDLDPIEDFFLFAMKEALKEGAREAIEHIAKDQGWEDSRDVYAIRFGFEPKYNKSIKKRFKQEKKKS